MGWWVGGNDVHCNFPILVADKFPAPIVGPHGPKVLLDGQTHSNAGTIHHDSVEIILYAWVDRASLRCQISNGLFLQIFFRLLQLLPPSRSSAAVQTILASYINFGMRTMPGVSSDAAHMVARRDLFVFVGKYQLAVNQGFTHAVAVPSLRYPNFRGSC